MVFFITALRRIGRGIYSKLFDGFFFVGLMGWDFSLALVNLITFKRKVGRVTPKGQPGEGGVWPEYSPPRKGDSRCSCPALNAMANHGVFYFFFHRYPQWINTSCMSLPYPRGCFYVSLPPPLPRYHCSRWTRYLFPRSIYTNPGDLQFLPFLLPFRAP